MDKLVYLNNLFDLYGELLTDKQQMYFKDYYFDNLSYGEISEKYNVSRNAIFHQLKIIEERLNFYEEKLQLYSKKDKINNLLAKLDNKEVQDEIKKIIEE